MERVRTENKRVIFANITWNNAGWRKIYLNPKAGHKYARKYPGHESLNFEFNKKGLDDEQNVYGFFQCTNAPIALSNNAVIIFHSKNLETKDFEIVGIYGDAKILKDHKRTKWNEFESDELLSNILAKKKLSLLFPKYLKASEYYKNKFAMRGGFKYEPIEFAEKVIIAEIKILQIAGTNPGEYKKLHEIYKFLTGYEYVLNENEDNDLREQEELYKADLKREEKIQYLQEVNPKTSEFVEFKGKRYKRDNITITLLKEIRDFKCQMCGSTIFKKDNSYYIEAAHIQEKKNKGPETPDNILILCPNHHKEFDLGNRKIIEKTNEKIVFELNGRRYDIDLSLK